MFYCKECAQKEDWPQGFYMSTGPCEICGETRKCFDVSSSRLNPPGSHVDGLSRKEAAE